MDVPDWLKPAAIIKTGAGTMRDSRFSESFVGTPEGGYHASVLNLGNYDIELECICNLGEYPTVLGRRYLGNIFNHRQVAPGEVDTGTFVGYEDFWEENGSVGPVWYEMVVRQLYYLNDGGNVVYAPIPYEFVISEQLPRGGGDPGPTPEPCPPDPLWPYPVLTAGQQSNSGGVISHRRVLGGNRRQAIT